MKQLHNLCEQEINSQYHKFIDIRIVHATSIMISSSNLEIFVTLQDKKVRKINLKFRQT